MVLQFESNTCTYRAARLVCVCVCDLLVLLPNSGHNLELMTTHKTGVGRTVKGVEGGKRRGIGGGER